jgi:hypothetical protein
MLAAMRAPTLTPRPVAGSVDELLAGATSREPFMHSDSKSGSGFERVVLDGEPHIVKYVHVDQDWIMRVGGDVGCKPLQVWTSGLMDVLPERIDHGTVAVAAGLGRNGWGAALLMRDLSAAIVPPGDDPIPLEEHLGYLDTMAALAARTWGWSDDVGLLPLANRYSLCSDVNLGVQVAKGYPDPVPRIAVEGWARFTERAPDDVVDLFRALRQDVQPILDALAGTLSALLHGDWKLGNVGTTADGRTVLIDWALPGFGPIGHELGWYLALNRARLPHSQEDAVAALRSALEAHGVATASWWDRQLAVCLLGTMVQFGWEKALGDDDELGWWCDRIREGAARL